MIALVRLVNFSLMRGIEKVRCRIDLDRNGRCPNHRDTQPGCNEGLRGHKHLVSGLDAARAQRQRERVETVAHANAVLRAAIGSEFIFEGNEFTTHDHMAALHDLRKGLREVIGHFGVAGVNIKKRNHGIILFAQQK